MFCIFSFQDESLPYGGIDGKWRGRKLFDCKPKHGLLVPASSILSTKGRLPFLGMNINVLIVVVTSQAEILAMKCNLIGRLSQFYQWLLMRDS